jgi:1-acyl-sn-glycerol-3-phosphate acyltransferase
MTPLLRTLFFFVVFWLHQILILPVLCLFLVLARGEGLLRHRRPINRISSTWGWMMCRLGGAKLTVVDRSGIPRDETVLFVSNHQGDFDIPALLATTGRPTAFVAKKELAHIPLVSHWMRVMGCIFLDRDDRRKQVEQIKQTVAHLRGGISMVIFPEGTRSHGPGMRPFAKGSLQVGVRAGVRLVPVTLRDTYTLYPKERKLFPGGSATVLFHPAIQPADLSNEERNHLHERVQAVIQAGLDERLEDER